MHAHRIQVLHVANSDAGVVGVAHDLVLDFFPAGERALDQHLPDRTRGESLADDGFELERAFRHPAAGTAERVGRPNHQRKPDRCREFLGSIDRRHRAAVRHRLADAQQDALEGLSILRLTDRRQRRPEDAHLAALEDTGVGERHRQVEPGLPTQSRQQPIRPLPFDDRGDRLDRQRLDIDAVRDPLVGHDGRRVRIHQDGAHTFFAKRLAGLRSRVVELGGLTDHDWPGPDDQDAGGTADRLAHRDRRRLATGDQVEELVEDHLVVLRPGCPFGVILHRADRQVVVHQALDRAIVQVAMTHAEAAARGEALGIDLELMVLRRHADPAGPQVEHRMIAAVVAEPQP